MTNIENQTEHFNSDPEEDWHNYLMQGFPWLPVRLVADNLNPAPTKAKPAKLALVEPKPADPSQQLTDLRLKLHGSGYHPVPVLGAHIDKPGAGKAPKMLGWQTKCMTADAKEIEKWTKTQPNSTNTGVLCGEIDGVDIDVMDEKVSAELAKLAVKLLGPTSLRRIGRAPKVLLAYRVETPHKKLSTPDLIFGDDVDDKNARAKVEILAEGQHFVAFGTHPDTKAPYDWPEKSPLDIPASAVPVVKHETLQQFLTEAEKVLRRAGARTAKEIEEDNDRKEEEGNKAAGRFDRNERSSREKIVDALDHVPNDFGYLDWIKMGYALYDGLGETGRDVWESWSATYPNNDPKVTAAKWSTFANGRTKIATLFYFAKRNGWWWDAGGTNPRPSDEAKPEAKPRDAKSGEAKGKTPMPYGFKFTDRGLVYQNPGDADAKEIHIAGAFEVEALTRDNDSDGWGVLLKWKDHDGKEHRHALAYQHLAGDGAEARRILMDQGLYISDYKLARSLFNSFLLQVTTSNRARSTDRVGWNGTAFVLPDECFGGKLGETIMLQNATSHEHLFRQAGTLEEWQEIPQLAVGNSRLILAISTAFAGPLLEPCKEEGGGIHYRGPSSIGKTTALHAAGSVWGGNGKNTGFTQTWRATANGLEGVCANHTDTLLPLDELAQVTPKDAGESVYMITNGAGKSRSRTDGTVRKPAKFRVMLLSSGEISLADKIAEDGRGKKMTAGQQVRVVDVPADAGAGMGLFENLHGFESGKALSKHLVALATARFYGTAGRAFLAAIMPKLDDIRAQAVAITKAFCDQYLPKGADGQVGRVAQRFALIAFAGELATNLGIIKVWEKGTAMAAAGKCFETWLKERGHQGAAEAHGGVEAVRDFLQMHGMARFIPAWEEEEQAQDHEYLSNAMQKEGARPLMPLKPPLPQRDLCGFRRRLPNDMGWEFYINDAGWAEMCQKYDSDALAKTLVERGVLLPAADGRRKTTHRIPGHGKGRYYYIFKMPE